MRNTGMKFECQMKAHKENKIIALCLNKKCQAETVCCHQCINEIHYDHINDMNYLTDLQISTKHSPISQIKNSFKQMKEQLSEYLEILEVQFNNYLYPLEQFLKSGYTNLNDLTMVGSILKQGNLDLIDLYFSELFENLLSTVQSELDNSFNAMSGFDELQWKRNHSKEIEEIRKLAILQYKQGKYVEALDLFERVLKANPNDLEIQEMKGCGLYQLAFYAESIVEFEKALKFNQRNADLYYWKGGAEQELKLYQDAIISYSKAKEINPSRYQSLINYIRICQSRMQQQ